MPQMTAEERLLLLQESFKNHKEHCEEQVELLRKDIYNIDKRVKDMEMSKQKTEYQYEQIMQTLNTLNEKTIPNLISQIEELKNKPVKRYDQAISGIIGAIFGAIGTFIVNLLLNKN